VLKTARRPRINLVVVCGSRAWRDSEKIRERLEQLPPTVRILTGGAPGADTLTYHIARRVLGLRVDVVKPDWKTYGKAAGLKRNLVLLDRRPDLVLAFWDGTSGGTAHVIANAKRRGIPVEVIEP
jgi:hypothetical protein